MSPTTLGTFYCVLSAGCYGLMNICQRELSESCDPIWVNCVQASVSTVVFGIFLTFTSIRGRSAWPPLSVALGLMALGVITQLGGASYQWSLGGIGLAIGNPLQMGVMLAGGAIMGRVLLGERVPWRATIAILFIVVAIIFLGSGAEEASEAMNAAANNTSETITVDPAITEGPAIDAKTNVAGQAVNQPGSMLAFWSVLAACFSGVAFATLTVGMRKTATENTSPEAIVFFINLMGILFLGPWAMARLGIDGMLATPHRDLTIMLATGVCNLLAFLLLAKALQLTTVVRVNTLNNSIATALTVLSGIIIFSEPTNAGLYIGIILTFVGIVLIGTISSDDEENEQATASSDC